MIIYKRSPKLTSKDFKLVYTQACQDLELNIPNISGFHAVNILGIHSNLLQSHMSKNEMVIWMDTANQNLSGLTPRELITQRKTERVYQHTLTI